MIKAAVLGSPIAHSLSPLLHTIAYAELGGTGATIGTSVIYLISLKLGRTVLLRYLKNFRINEQKLERVETWFEKYGDKAVLIFVHLF